MPVVINEVEILDAPPAAPAAPPSSTPHTEPAYEQLRRLMRDLESRQRRIEAD